MLNEHLTIGTWINSYEKGVFRVERIIERYYGELEQDVAGDQLGKPYSDRIIISKRLLNSKFKKSLGYDSCSEYCVSPLTPGQRAELEQVLANRPTILTELDRYQIPPLVWVYNMPFQITTTTDMRKFDELIRFCKTGKSFSEIASAMRTLGITPAAPNRFSTHSLQLINYDEERKDKQVIWRDARLLQR